MRITWRRVLAFSMAVLMLLTAPDNSFLTVRAKAAVTVADGTYLLSTAVDSKVVSAGDSETNALIAGKSQVKGMGEVFELINNSDGTVSFKSKANGKYVCAVFDESSQLLARSDSIGGWEKFTLEEVGTGQYALKIQNTIDSTDYYVSADFNTDGTLKATATAASGWEAFILNPVETYTGIWYYNASWSGSSVYLNYRSALTGWTSEDGLEAIQAVELESRPGLFYVAGTDELYMVADTDLVQNAVQLFFTKDAGDGNGATAWSENYIYNNITSDANKDCTDFDPAATNLYLADGLGGNIKNGYATLEELKQAIAAYELDNSFNVHVYDPAGEWTGAASWYWGHGATESATATKSGDWYTFSGIPMDAGYFEFGNVSDYDNTKLMYYTRLGLSDYYFYIGQDTSVAGYATAEEAVAASGLTVDTLIYYYAGTDSDGIDAANKTLWTTVYADVFYYKEGTTEKVMLLEDALCTSDGDGWFYVNVGVSALNRRFENGIYVQFKSAAGVKSSSGTYHTETDEGTITAAYQYLNNYRVYSTSQMTIFKSKADAIKSLKNTELGNEVPTDKTRVWYYFPGGWNDYYVFYSTAAGGSNPADQAYAGNYSQMVKQEAYTDALGGAWYYADVPSGANYIYFDEDAAYGNGGNISQMYDISSKTSNEIFCVVNDGIILNGWSSSTAEIAKYYGLVNVPASNEISMPITILDYNADNLFFEYDMYWLRNMTMVLGNQGGWYGMSDMGISADWTVPWPTIDVEDIRPGDAPRYDRNGKEYVSGVLEDTLVNGYPAYTEQAVTYIAKVTERAYNYYAGDLRQEPDAIQPYNKTELFNIIYRNITGDSEMDGEGLKESFLTTDWHAAYEASKAKYTAANFVLSEYDITADTELTCMDYAYYVMNNLYDTNSKYNKDYGMYSYLVLKRTSPNVYGFYANFETNNATAYNLPQNYEIIYNPSLKEKQGTIFNNLNGDTTIYQEQEGQQITLDTEGNLVTDEDGNYVSTTVEGYAGLFPYNKDKLDRLFGEGINETTDVPKEKEEGYVNQDGNAQDEKNLYRYYDYIINSETVKVEYIDATAWSGVAAADVTENQFVTEVRNYNYALKLSGKFRFDYTEGLYFTFTGDDDVVLYINGVKVLDLSGAHQAASYTVYLSDLVDDGIIQMTDGAYYDLDFFYMERHTTWSNMRIETNIDVIDVSGQVQKHAYDKDGNIIPSGSIVDTNEKVTFEYELNAETGDGLVNLGFEDPALGISLSSEEIILGSYVDAEGNIVNRQVEDLVVAVGDTEYTNLTEDELKAILEEGIDAGERILISNIQHVMTTGVDGPVTATMNGETDNRELSSTAEHRLFIGDPSISVTKTAANETGSNLPNNTTVQAGTIVDFTITATNIGGLPLYHMAIADEELGIQFGIDENGEVIAKYNRDDQHNTEVTDLVFTVRGTGVSDGIYTVSTEEELKELIEKLSQIVYPTGASVSVSGIKHPITDTCTSTAVGTADSLNNYEGSEETGWEQFGLDYQNYLENGGTEPDYTDYVDVSGKEEACEAYAQAYKAYVAQVVTDGFLSVQVPDVDTFFTQDESVTDDAALTLHAKQAAYNYYTQAGQTIEICLQDETEVTLEQAGTWGDVTTAVEKEIGTFELTAGAHNVSFYNNDETEYGFNLYQITLTNQTTGETYVLDVHEDGIISDGDTVLYPDEGVIALNSFGASVTFPVELTADGTYTAAVTYISGHGERSGALVFDYMPGDYILTEEDGTPITTFTGSQTGEAVYTIDADSEAGIQGATIVVNNSGAYPAIQYTYAEGESGRVLVGVTDINAGEGVIPDTITVTSYDVSDNVYVLDYGLKVDLTDTTWNNGLFQDDQITAQSGDVVTVLGAKSVGEKIATKADDYVYKYMDESYTAYAEGTYGTVGMDGSNASAIISYTLNSFLEGVDRYAYAVQIGRRDIAAADKNVTNSTPVMEGNVTIMPAAIVYYEDNFASVITNGEAEGTPDASAKQGNGLDTQYGYDQTYADGKDYSNSGYTALSSADKLAFTFQGTGFDILTRTSDANLKVSVYDASKFEIKIYTYGEGKLGITVVRKAGVADTETALKSLTINAFYENGTLNQLPLISMDMEAYGKYIVLAQKTGTKRADLHVDGIRIYNPIIIDEEVSDAYDNAQGEEGAAIREIRNMIFGEGYTFDYTNPEDPTTATIEEGKGAVAGLVQMVGEQLNITTGSTVVESYTGANLTSADIAASKAENPVNTSSLLGYAVSGPNNELYLTGADYAFGAVINDITADSMLQIGLKAISDSATVQYKALDGSWKDIPDASALVASIEMYYKLDVADLWQNNGRTVLLVRVSSGTASLTNLKYNGVTFEKITAEALGATVVESENTSSFNVLSSSAAGSDAVITFSVDNTVVDFTVADASGNIVFTYGTGAELPAGITVGKRLAGDLDIYVVKMPKTAGTYTIYTSAGTQFGTAEFTIQ